MYKRNVIKVNKERKRNHLQTPLPMKYFTQEEARPSDLSLNIVRQFAYAYNALKTRGQTGMYCLN